MWYQEGSHQTKTIGLYFGRISINEKGYMAKERLPFGRVFALRTAEGQRGVGAPTLPRPTQDQALTDALTEGVIREIKIDEQAKREKRRLPLKVKLGLAATGTLALVGGTIWGLNKAFGDDEPAPQPTSNSQSIDSFPNTFTDNLVPRAGAETRVENSNPNPIRAQKFKTPPLNRTPSEIIYSQNTSIDQLPVIKEHTAEYSRDGTYNNFQTGIGFIREERSETYIARRVTPNGLEPIKQEYTRYPIMGVNGYTIGKEIQPDGNVFLAVYVPGENGLSNPDGAENSSLSVENTTDDGKQGKISNAIVWLKAENFGGYSLPFSFNSSWDQSSTNRHDEDKKTNIPEELFKYIEIGDPVRTAGGMLQIHPWAEDLLVKNYQEQKNHLTYEKAREKYSNIVNNNTETLQTMLEDAKTGGISLKEQFESKRYVIQISNVRFVPLD